MTAKARFLGAFAVLSLLTGPARGQYFEWSVFDGGGLDPRAEITAVAQGDNGMLYLGTDRGLWAHDGQRAWPLELEPDPGSALSARMPRGDSVWAGLRSGRVYAGPADGPLHPLASEEGFPDVAITALVRDREGLLWMGTAGEGAYVPGAGSRPPPRTDCPTIA
jgi:ligand-binding sensor domain-containing protein